MFCDESIRRLSLTGIRFRYISHNLYDFKTNIVKKNRTTVLIQKTYFFLSMELLNF